MIPKDCPINKPRKRSPKKDGEAVVVRECLLFLKQCPEVIYTEKRTTGAVQFQDGGFIQFGSKGAADIWCLVRCRYEKHYPKSGEHFPKPYWVCAENMDGSCAGSCHTHVELEIKRADGKGRLSASQKKFQDFCRTRGIPYYVITCVAELEKALEENQ